MSVRAALRSALVGWRPVVAGVALAWAAALAYSTLSGRALYGDGSLYVLIHFQVPHRFDDYDFHRSFAGFISQVPILVGERLGLQTVAAYAALYSLGVFLPAAAAFVIALYLARDQPVLFAANAFATLVFGFGVNFINSEANLFFGLAVLCATLLALERGAPLLRAFLLPLIGFALLRIYEGMLLIGPLLAVWSLAAATRAHGDLERVGLVLSALLFTLGAVMGAGGVLTPRDPGNMAGFLRHVLLFPRYPHAFLALAALSAAGAVLLQSSWPRIGAAAASAVFGSAFLEGMIAREGYYAYGIYYVNRAFLSILLAAFVAALLLTWWRRPAWLARTGNTAAYPVLLIPLVFAIAVDVLGTARWNEYVDAFCSVLRRPLTPAERLAALEASGAVTAWTWAHPPMSALLRDRGSSAAVANPPDSPWQPFPPEQAPALAVRGVCEAPLLGNPP
jgi:hypothetical protein